MPEKTRYEKRKEEHRCTVCGCQDERTLRGLTRCQQCLDKSRTWKGRRGQAERHQRHYAKMKEEHRCVLCGKQDERTLAGLIRCAECDEKHLAQKRSETARAEARVRQRNRAAEWRSQGRCSRCGRIDDRTRNGCLCLRCNGKAWRGRRERRIRNEQRETNLVEEILVGQ